MGFGMEDLCAVTRRGPSQRAGDGGVEGLRAVRGLSPGGHWGVGCVD